MRPCSKSVDEGTRLLSEMKEQTLGLAVGIGLIGGAQGEIPDNDARKG